MHQSIADLFEQDYYRHDKVLYRRRTRRTYLLAAYNQFELREALTTPSLDEPRLAGDAALAKPFSCYWEKLSDYDLTELWKRLAVAEIEGADNSKVKSPPPPDQ